MSTVRGQQNPPINPPVLRDPFPALTAYLGLTAQQVVNVARLNAEFAVYLGEKTRRAATVNAEIREETQAASVNPTALGVRYYELEAICREAKGRQADLLKNVQAVLTPEQKPKLQTLQAAFSLFPTIAEGQNVNMMGRVIPGSKPPMVSRFPADTTLYWTPNWNTQGPLLPGCQAAPGSTIAVIGGIIGQTEPE